MKISFCGYEKQPGSFTIPKGSKLPSKKVLPPKKTVPSQKVGALSLEKKKKTIDKYSKLLGLKSFASKYIQKEKHRSPQLPPGGPVRLLL